jgi:membrane-associated phospholipid phosphatase
MELKIANLISWIFHPMLMPTYALLLIFNHDTFFVLLLPEKLKLVLAGLIVANTLLIPLIFIWMMKKRGIISSYQLPERGERTFPFVVTALFYFATWFMMQNLGLPGVYYIFVLGGATLIIIASIINLYWKISIHALGIGGLTGGFLALNYQMLLDSTMLILLLIFVSGLVGYARLKLNTHNQSQVYVGYAVGVTVMVGIVAFL